jgi:hypothetical protein
MRRNSTRQHREDPSGATAELFDARNGPEISGSVRSRWKPIPLWDKRRHVTAGTVQAYRRLIRWSRIRIGADHLGHSNTPTIVKVEQL